MDIFAIAQEAVDIEAKEIKAIAKEEASEKASKSFKLDIKVAIQAAAKKDYGWYGRNDLQNGDDGYDHNYDYGAYYTAEEKEKGFQPFILNLWLSKIVSPNKAKAITSVDEGYAILTQRTNNLLNANVFTVSKAMNWLLACSISPYDLETFNTDFIKAASKGKSSKIDSRVIKYISAQLWCSTDKVVDMIDNGLITEAEMKEIGKDLDTLEAPTKKKK